MKSYNLYIEESKFINKKVKCPACQRSLFYDADFNIEEEPNYLHLECTLCGYILKFHNSYNLKWENS